MKAYARLRIVGATPATALEIHDAEGDPITLMRFEGGRRDFEKRFTLDAGESALLRVSTRAIAPSATAQPTHSPSGSSSGKGCTKTPCRSVARVDEAPPAASPQHTARAISR